jgi:hypothetical protein
MANLIELLKSNPDQANAIIATMALLVSFMSVVFTVVALYLTRQHNYKSLTPIASIPVSDYEDKVAVKIKNAGVGPLIIQTFRATRREQTEDDLVSLMPELPDGLLWDTFFDDLDGACIPPGEQLDVLQLSGDTGDIRFGQARDACRKVLSETTVVLSYKDIYGRRMPQVTKSLRWFGRHFEDAG